MIRLVRWQKGERARDSGEAASPRSLDRANANTVAGCINGRKPVGGGRFSFRSRQSPAPEMPPE